jgi:predicted nucleic acid-binding protein
VRFVVLDPQLLAAAFLAPNGRCRKLLVVLAYGRLVSNVERVSDAEADKLEEDARAARGPTAAGRDMNELRERDDELRLRLVEQLPVMTPKDFGLAASPEVFDEVQELMQAARQHRPSLPADAADLVYRRLSHHMAKTDLRLDNTTLPWYTEHRARERDWLIHIATQTEAEFLVTGDARLASEPNGATCYVHEPTGNWTQAWRLDSFISEMEGFSFTLDDVDGGLIPGVE